MLPHIRGLSHQGKKFVTWVLSFSPYRQCRNVRMREVIIMKMIFSFATNVWNRRIMNSILLQLRKYRMRPFLKNCVMVLPIPIHCLSMYLGIFIFYLFFRFRDFGSWIRASNLRLKLTHKYPKLFRHYCGCFLDNVFWD